MAKQKNKGFLNVNKFKSGKAIRNQAKQRQNMHRKSQRGN